MRLRTLAMLANCGPVERIRTYARLGPQESHVRVHPRHGWLGTAHANAHPERRRLPPVHAANPAEGFEGAAVFKAFGVPNGQAVAVTFEDFTVTLLPAGASSGGNSGAGDDRSGMARVR